MARRKDDGTGTLYILAMHEVLTDREFANWIDEQRAVLMRPEHPAHLLPLFNLDLQRARTLVMNGVKVDVVGVVLVDDED